MGSIVLVSRACVLLLWREKSLISKMPTEVREEHKPKWNPVERQATKQTVSIYL